MDSVSKPFENTFANTFIISVPWQIPYNLNKFDTRSFGKKGIPRKIQRIFFSSESREKVKRIMGEDTPRIWLHGWNEGLSFQRRKLKNFSQNRWKEIFLFENFILSKNSNLFESHFFQVILSFHSLCFFC